MLTELEPLAEALAQNRQLLDELLEQMDESALNRAPAAGEYTGRQILAHLAGAESGMTGLMRRMAAGENPRIKAEYNNDYYNARQQDKRAHLTTDQLRAELVETRADLIAFIESLRETDLSKQGQHPVAGESTVLGVLQVLQQHERAHIEDLARLSRAPA